MSEVVGTDEELMAAYARGDSRAFSALFTRMAPRLFGYFMRTTRDRVLADDLVQATFLRLHAVRHTYRADAPLSPWLFTIASRVRIDALRRKYRLAREAGDDDLDRFVDAEAPDDADLASDRDALARSVRAAVDALPASQREVVHLHRFEGLTFAEISQALGLKEVTVRVRAFRAYDRLRERLKDVPQAREPL
jgi:RNA polymerase sigma-70 factor (ECF subfamily)